jgi:hypothetical protein
MQKEADAMALEQHLDTLRKRHAELDTRIRTEEARPYPDDIVLHKWKAEKLGIKDTIVQLMMGSEARQQAA